MGAPLLAGCVLLAYSLPAAVFFLLIARRAQLVIVMLAAAFFWMMSFTFSSLIWSAIPPLQQSSYGWALVPVSVLVLEAVRVVFVRLYFRSERSFSVVSINAIVFPLVDLYSAIAAGVGFGACHSIMLYGTIIAHAHGPGELLNDRCPSYNAFVAAACSALLYNVLHITLMILAFDAYRTMHPLKISALILLHAAAGAFSILSNVSNGCILSLPLLAATVAVSIGVALFITHSPYYRSSKARRVHQA